MVNEDALSEDHHKCTALEAFLTERLGDETRALLILQPVPDPDAIGSATGMKALLETKYGVDCDVGYSSTISHPQNQTEMNVLNLRFKHIDSLDLESYNFVMVLDTVPVNTGFDIDVDVVIDHHMIDVDVTFADIRPVGACSTLVWQHLKSAGFDFQGELGKVVATALAFGIANDTHNFISENVTDLDMEAHRDLLEYADRKKLADITNYPLPAYLFELKAKAFENQKRHGSFLLTNLGVLPPKKRDALPVIADEYVRQEGVETVIVFAQVGAYYEASVRSCNASINVHHLCQDLFGTDFGGGKQGAGGARAPMGLLYSEQDDEEDRSYASELLFNLITKRVIRYIEGV